jgi:uncharacterized membrane protein YeaQ/YmgE (transglycosylase-associated protein family)
LLNFLWWFVVGPAVGWLAGKLMRSTGSAGLDALAGLVGAILAGAVCVLIGFDLSNSALGACITGAAGALAVTFIYKRVAAKEAGAAPRKTNARSYTSYKSRMDK